MPTAGAAALGLFARGHWGVEKGLPWCLDVTFREDTNRTRDTNAGANLGVVRRVAAARLKQETGKGVNRQSEFAADGSGVARSARPSWRAPSGSGHSGNRPGTRSTANAPVRPEFPA